MFVTGTASSVHKISSEMSNPVIAVKVKAVIVSQG
jgi:hypothetical protein